MVVFADFLAVGFGEWCEARTAADPWAGLLVSNLLGLGAGA